MSPWVQRSLLGVLCFAGCGSFASAIIVFPLGGCIASLSYTGCYLMAKVAHEEGYFDDILPENASSSVFTISLDVASAGGCATKDLAAPISIPWMLGRGSEDGRIHSSSVNASPAVGIVGCPCSVQSDIVAPLAASFSIPMISGGSTAPHLSDKGLYPYFARTMPSSAAAGTVTLILQFGWRLVALLYMNDGAAYTGQAEHALPRLSDAGVTVTQDTVRHVQAFSSRRPPYPFDHDEWREAAARVAARRPQPRIFFMPGDSRISRIFIRFLHDEQHLVSDQTMFFFSEVSCSESGWSGSPERAALPPEDPNYDPFFDYPWGDLGVVIRGSMCLKPEAVQAKYYEPAFQDFLANLTQEKLVAAGWPGHIPWYPGTLDDNFLSKSMFSSLAFEAAAAFVITFGRLLGAGVPASEMRGSFLRDEIKNTRYAGISGNVSFDENGDRLAPYTIRNFQVNAAGELELHTIGLYDSASSRLTFDQEPIFADGTTTVPLDRPEPCGPGEEYTGHPTGCAPCQPGRASYTGESCSRCIPGYFAAEAGASQCTSAHAGAYVEEVGATANTSCPAGTFAKDRGSVHCLQCSEGNFQDTAGATGCMHCAMGSYSQYGSSECLECPAGFTTEHPGAAHLEQCQCPTGTYCHGTYPDCDCMACPMGMECGFGAQSEALSPFNPEGRPPLVLPGFYTRASDPHSVYRCRNAAECPGGAPESCASNREGLACASCRRGTLATSNGECRDCSHTDAILTFLMVFLGGAALVALCLVGRLNTMTTNMHTLTAGICLGQIVIAMQSLTVIGRLSLVWEDPIAWVFKLVSVLSLNIELLHFGCVVSDGHTVMVFVAKILIFPIMATFLVWVSAMLARFKPSLNINVDSTLNSLGLLFLMFYMSLSTLALSPMQCAENPNHTRFSANNPSVICGTNPTFMALASFSSLGILFYSIVPFAFVILLTLRYPSLVASGKGHRVVHRYRFLFQRFSVECYWYAPFYLLRNFMISLVPVLFVDAPHMQVYLSCTILLFFSVVQAWVKPWRYTMLNVLDAVVSTCLVLLLLGASTLAGAQSLEDLQSLSSEVQAFFMTLVSVIVAGFATAVGVQLFKRLTQRRTYLAFLSHHKGACAAGARLMKMELETYTNRRVFLDSDELDDLELLLHTVKSGIENMVVLLTSETLWRPWCAGEIAISYMNSIPVVGIAYDNFVKPSKEDLDPESLARRYDAQSLAPLALQGVSVEAISKAFSSLLAEDLVQMQRVKVLEIEDHEDPNIAAKVTSQLSNASESKLGKVLHVSSLMQDNRSSRCINKTSTGSSTMALLANCQDGEAVSTAHILVRMVTQLIQKAPKLLLNVSDLHAKRDDGFNPVIIIVVLSGDCLSSVSFTHTIMMSADFWPDAELLTVRSPDFQFQTADMLTRNGTYELAARASELSEADVKATFDAVFSTISVPFTPSGHISVLTAEAQRLTRRLASVEKKKKLGGALSPKRRGSAGAASAELATRASAVSSVSTLLSLPGRSSRASSIAAIDAELADACLRI